MLFIELCQSSPFPLCVCRWLNTIFLFNFSLLDIKKRLESPRPNYSFSSFFHPRCLLLHLLLLAHVVGRVSAYTFKFADSVGSPEDVTKWVLRFAHTQLSPQFRGKSFSTNFLRGTTETNTHKSVQSAPRNRIIINRTNTFFHQFYYTLFSIRCFFGSIIFCGACKGKRVPFLCFSHTLSRSPPCQHTRKYIFITSV